MCVSITHMTPLKPGIVIKMNVYLLQTQLSWIIAAH